MTPLTQLLNTYRHAATTQREKGTYFEQLVQCYFQNEASYQTLYSDVCTYGEWAAREGLDQRDTGIDLVAKTKGTGELHAIQCKFYQENYTIQKKDIDSFFTASGKESFSHRFLVTTTHHWSEHAKEALRNQKTPVSTIDLRDLENSQIDWSQYQPNQSPVVKPKKQLRPHQKNALEDVLAGLQKADRGKLIMACGTGKTFVSLQIAEQQAGAGKQVLLLVPSLALLSQSLTEWTQESRIPLNSFAVCSDSDVGKKQNKDDDTLQIVTHELRYPVTTDAESLARAVLKRHDPKRMTVVFSTYHSIAVSSDAQKEHGLSEFDLIICDEAHRTTGATFEGVDKSPFVRVHDDGFIRAAKRLYMTATPRIYANHAKATAERDNSTLCSMDDEKLYGEELHVITISKAVQQQLLVDYKVIVLAIDERHVSRRLQELLTDENNQIRMDDAAKIVGCWKALSKQGLTDDTEPMRRAVAFCQVIEIAKDKTKHKVSSKQIARLFQGVVETYQNSEDNHEEAAIKLVCEAEHVDGSMNASQKQEKIDWLKSKSSENTCRILSNVRCLSEGVDVPSLDAVLFLTPRNSQIDVVQSVGRVMRNAPGKKRGYVILPVVIPAGIEPNEALNDNKTYAVVWEVLQALRSHDNRFDAMINKLDLTGKDTNKMEVIAITDSIPKPQKGAKKTDKPSGKKQFSIGESVSDPKRSNRQYDLSFEIGEIERAIYAKLVEKVGNRHHWEEWANDIAQIAKSHIDQITQIVSDSKNAQEREAFQRFCKDLRAQLNDRITESEIIEMLAQHLITKPVFDALFEQYSFAQHNPISKAMQNILEVLHEHHLETETKRLQEFYDSVRFRAKGIDNAAGKQKIIIELYDKFFRNAFPKMTERLGIVYTPIEVVDFILHSVNHLLAIEFGKTLGSAGVHILDPFTGTGTFITRLLQSGLIDSESLPHKYQHEIHANEIVLLAYYIAAINIESIYHDRMGGEYQPFPGICLTDTFQSTETKDLVDQMLADNHARREHQKNLSIQVILGNPPYSAGQNSANDNNQNVAYLDLDQRIRDTYAEKSTATNKNALYDSYIRAIRWASDRIGDSGIIGFVTNAGFLDSNSADGLRKCLAEEFSSIYVFHLRGNQRTAGELSRKEGGKIFGSGSRAPIAISLLIKNPKTEKRGQIYFHDIGDRLSREDKLAQINRFGSVVGISAANAWQILTPDRHGDWINQRNDSFEQFIVLGDKKEGTARKLFETYSNGVKTNRDAWCYNASQEAVAKNMKQMIAFYNSEVVRYEKEKSIKEKSIAESVDDFVNTDPTKISWTRGLKKELVASRQFYFEKNGLVQSLYRPFTKQWFYFNRQWNEMVYQMPRLFPNAAAKNRVIGVSGIGARSGFSALMADALPNLHTLDTGQCFPLYLYEETENGEKIRQEAITAVGLSHFQAAYPNETISREDVFYYVYGLLHSTDYREQYADNLSKELPRIPRAKTAEDFWNFSQAGRALAELHVNYESVPMYPAQITGEESKNYRVEKMRYGKNEKGKDLTTVQYNESITVTGIPLEAYEYIVNGKPAIDWVLERQCVKTDKDSGIVNDANEWAISTRHNPRYPLELLLRVVTVSVETMQIVRKLPGL